MTCKNHGRIVAYLIMVFGIADMNFGLEDMNSNTRDAVYVHF
jgi:hypothetical protein